MICHEHIQGETVRSPEGEYVFSCVRGIHELPPERQHRVYRWEW